MPSAFVFLHDVFADLDMLTVLTFNCITLKVAFDLA